MKKSDRNLGRALKFAAGSDSYFDRTMEGTAIEVIIKAARDPDVTTIGGLAEKLEIPRNRAARLCSTLKIRKEINAIFTANKLSSDRAQA